MLYNASDVLVKLPGPVQRKLKGAVPPFGIARTLPSEPFPQALTLETDTRAERPGLGGAGLFPSAVAEIKTHKKIREFLRIALTGIRVKMVFIAVVLGDSPVQ